MPYGTCLAPYPRHERTFNNHEAGNGEDSSDHKRDFMVLADQHHHHRQVPETRPDPIHKAAERASQVRAKKNNAMDRRKERAGHLAKTQRRLNGNAG